MKKKIFLLFALLCAVAQGAWADDDDTYKYEPKTKPEFKTSYDGKENVAIIRTAAELAYVTEHFNEGSGYNDNQNWDDMNFYLAADIDMGENISWMPLGRESYWVTKYSGKFWGNGHTIRYRIWNLSEENQGLFATIHEDGEVHDVTVVCRINADEEEVGGIAGENWGLIENCTVHADIECSDDYVGGIVGENRPCGIVRGCHVTGTIKGTGSATSIGGICGWNISGGEDAKLINCWVEADVSSEYDGKAYVGGICGANSDYLQYCCMTGNVTCTEGRYVGGIAGSNSGSGRAGGKGGGSVTYAATTEHISFLGTITNNNSRVSDFIGDGYAGAETKYREFNQAEYDAAISAGYTLYANAIKNLFELTVSTTGTGSVTTAYDNGNAIDFDNVKAGQMVRVTVRTGLVESITFKDDDGKDVEHFARTQYGDNYYWFQMPRSNVSVNVTFKATVGDGSEANPYRIGTYEEWVDFRSRLKGGEIASGAHIVLTDVIDFSTGGDADLGTPDHPFEGTFDGGGHTLEIRGNSLFYFAKNATIKNLNLTGSTNSALHPRGSIVQNSEGTLNLINCRSSVTFSDLDMSDNHGGLVGKVSGSATIEGCVFDGTFKSNGYTASYGGFIGEVESGSTVTIRNSLMKPASVDANLLANTFVNMSSGTPTIENSYFVYADNMATNQGTQARAITAGEGVTLSGLGAATTTYGSNGITIYAAGIGYGGNYYAGSGETVALNLSHGHNTGYTFSQYTATAGTLASAATSTPTLTMPDADVTIGIDWTRNTASLTDTGDNTTFINGHDGDVYDITLAGRTLYKDGKWNTLCLPFSVVLEGSPLEGATARYLSEAKVSGSTLSLTFSEPVETLLAGEPYIIKWDRPDDYVAYDGSNAATCSDIVSPAFTAVRIDNYTYAYDTADLNTDADDTNNVETDQRVRFQGTYAPLALTPDDKSILFMGAANTLYYPLTGATLNAHRAYFKIGDDDPASARQLAAFRISFGGEENTTGIISISKESRSEGVSDGWYSLDGRRLSQQPTQRGIYINNGKKTVIK